MTTIVDSQTEHARVVESDDLKDLYFITRRIPSSNGTLLHAYGAEVLIPASQVIVLKPKGVKTHG
jgi:hypothetical protein